MIWSYSFLNDLATCPHRAYRKYVKRDLPRETSPELEEGIRVHKLFEDRINNRSVFPTLPPDYEAFVKPLVGPLTRAEVKLGMTEDFRPAMFFGRETPDGKQQPWGRGKADVLIVNPPSAFIVDWKTGKVREDDRELRQLALLVRANYPEVHRISGCYVWLKEGRMGVVYDLSDVNRTYHGTVASMAQAQAYEAASTPSTGSGWPKTPNPLCHWRDKQTGELKQCAVFDCEFRREK